ncbi:MAG TPA: methionyl-tRNA formyltransferase [Clostridia bacterium]|nr:methionyl-tRNA formyltransferase [Clostridia bacterium]
MTRFVFMGTPQFAVIILDHLEAAGYVPALVVTQPDRPCGRGQKETPSPVALWAFERGIPTVKPDNCRAADLREELRVIAPQCLITAAFGQILPASILTIPVKGCLNIHASLLPRYRGASPVQAALLAGDKETGVTLMRMDEGLDTGPLLAQARMVLTDEINAGELDLALARLGGELIAAKLEAYLEGKLSSRAQDEAFASMTHRIKKADGRVDFTRSAPDVHNHIRAMNPWPGAFTFLDKKRYKLNRTRVYDGEIASQSVGELFIIGKSMVVSCGQGAIELLEIQPQSGSSMPCEACAHNFVQGSVFDVC